MITIEFQQFWDEFSGLFGGGHGLTSQALMLPLTLMVLALRKVPLSLLPQQAVSIFLDTSICLHSFNFFTVTEVQKPLLLRHF